MPEDPEEARPARWPIVVVGLVATFCFLLFRGYAPLPALAPVLLLGVGTLALWGLTKLVGAGVRWWRRELGDDDGYV